MSDVTRLSSRPCPVSAASFPPASGTAAIEEEEEEEEEEETLVLDPGRSRRQYEM
jgi:hypothetical protein